MLSVSEEKIILIRGGGDLATGVVQKFYRAGFRVVVLETKAPTAIRRSVSLSEAVYDGVIEVEDMICRKVSKIAELEKCWRKGELPLLIDPCGKSIEVIKPSAVIDAIMAKKNMGTFIDMADITIALGPGFNAGKDVHAVIETLRGHDLGRLILQGYAKPDTGVPGEIEGESISRVIRAPVSGKVVHRKQIGNIVEQEDVLFSIVEIDDDGTSKTSVDVEAPVKGLLRGLIREGLQVYNGLKVADIDPREDIDYKTISDKARCIGGAVLEAYFCLKDKYRVSEGRRNE
ncbi:MAG: selenium-dependent molybdenum cofactor biosynthesis protein YqeB [Oscillospiraceae bacterium]|nr:selenium-dependent molybdenum cofactor biosynthesis protein YqeB [Oscillospiraceae bacterium]